MSTKTTFKRVALVAVASLGFGLLSAAPSSAAGATDGTDNSTVTAITAGTAGAAQVGQQVQVPVTVTGSFTTGTARTLKLAVLGVTSPTGSSVSYAIGADVSGTLTAATTTNATLSANTLVTKTYATGNGHLGGAAMRLVDAANATTQFITASDAPTATSVKVYVMFTADKAGTYTFTVINDTTAGGTLNSGEKSSALITVNTAAPAASLVITMMNTGTAQASTSGVVAKIQALDAAGLQTTLGAADVISLTSSSTSMTIDGAASKNLVASDFGAGTPSSGMATVLLASSTAATYVLTATFGGALPAYTTTKSTTFTATTASAYVGTATDATSPVVIANYGDAGTYVDATSTSHQVTSAPSLTGATGAGLYVIPAGAQVWQITDTVTADAAIKIAVQVTEIGGSISGIAGGANVYTIPVTLTLGVGTFTVTTVATASSSATAFQGYTVKVLSSGTPVYFGASVVPTGGTATVTGKVTTYAAVTSGLVSVIYTVLDGYGTAVSGASVLGNVTGRNTKTLLATTGADGTATLSYTDAGTTATATADSIAVTASFYTSTTLTQPTTTTTVSYSANNAVATAVMTSGNTTAGVANTSISYKDIAAGTAGPSATTQAVTVLVKNAATQVLAGVPVTFSVAGTGCAIPSTKKTVYTGATGVATSAVYAWISGTCTISAVAGTITATGTTSFTQQSATETRTISATVAGQLVTAVEKDRFGNPVVGGTVYAIISSGAGYFGKDGSRSTSGTTDATGSIGFVISGGSAAVKLTTINPATDLATDQSTAAAGYVSGAVTTPVVFTAAAAGDLVTDEIIGDTLSPVGISSVSVDVVGDTSALDQAQAATDAAAEATDAANAATDAANAAAEAADAATAAAQDAADAVAALSAQVATLISGLKAQLTALTNLVIKIQKKVKA